jgi:hypothetical protein
MPGWLSLTLTIRNITQVKQLRPEYQGLSEFAELCG